MNLLDPERDQYGKAEVEPLRCWMGEQGDAEYDNGSQQVAVEQHLPTAPSVEEDSGEGSDDRIWQSRIAKVVAMDGRRLAPGENRTNVARAAWNKPSQNCPVAPEP